MPPTIVRGFSRDALPAPRLPGETATTTGGAPLKKRVYVGMGKEMGDVEVAPGKTVGGGGMLMRGTWNAAIHEPLAATFDPALDVIVHKNRLSGFWGSSTPCGQVLNSLGIRTLLWSGVNSDQCVSGSFQDASAKGWDTIMLSDCCGTASPEYARQGIEWNVARGGGFVMTSKELQEGLEA